MILLLFGVWALPEVSVFFSAVLVLQWIHVSVGRFPHVLRECGPRI